MPGPHKEVYATTTLSICIFTTIVCGGFTDKILTIFGMKEELPPSIVSGVDSTDSEEEHLTLNRLTFKPQPSSQSHNNSRYPSILEYQRQQIRQGIKGVWDRFDDNVLKPHFGGEGQSDNQHHNHHTEANNGHHRPQQRWSNGDDLGNYELGSLMVADDEYEDED